LMESRLGHDFSQVRVHMDAEANESANQIGALAYTKGQEIVFATANPGLETPQGLYLLAHELAHVVQQKGAARNNPALTIADTSSHHEAEADEVARSVISNCSGNQGANKSGYVHTSLRSGSTLQRKPASATVEAQPASKDGSSEIKSVKVWLNAFIPGSITGLTREVTKGPYKGKSVIPGPFSGVSDCFLTDNRGFSDDISASARMHSEIRIDFTRELPGSTEESHATGQTHELNCEDGALECSEQASKSRMKFTKIEKSGLHAIDARLAGAANNPCFTGSPDIDYEGLLRIDAGLKYVSFVGRIDDFPAFEMYAVAEGGEGKALFQLMPKEGKTPLDLFGEATREVVGVAKIGERPELRRTEHGEDTSGPAFWTEWEKNLKKGLSKLGASVCQFPEKHHWRSDNRYWEPVKDDPKYAAFKPKSGVAPSRAIDELFENLDAWDFDCAMYVELARLYAFQATLGAKKFDAEFAGLKLRQHGSTGINVEPHDAETEDQVSFEKIWNESPVGTNVEWTNRDAPEHTAWRNENAVKSSKGKSWKDDRYDAFPLGTNLSEDQIKLSLAEKAPNFPDAAEKQKAYIKKNVYRHQLQLLVRSK
jgi:uncharacterized protein DUF4157/protein-glutamine gamma-glutamyltransferase-like protein